MTLGPPTSLWRRRLVPVLGKGGVGRSTVALALAWAAAARGRGVALVEVHGASALARRLGFDDRAPGARAVAPNLDLWSLTPADCLEAYVRDRMGRAPLVGPVLRSRVMSALLDAIPGMADLLHHGRIHSLMGRYDLVIVDAPATGHGIAFLQTPDAVSDMTRAGPLFDEARLIADRTADPAFTAAVVVTLPEDLPTTEALELVRDLGPMAAVVAAVVVDRVAADPLPPELPWPTLRRALGDSVLAAVGDRHVARLHRQRSALARLRAGLDGVPAVELPEVDGTPDPATLGEVLGAALDAA